MHRQILTCVLLVGAVQGLQHVNPTGTFTSVSRGDAPACVNRSEPSIIDDVEGPTF